MKVFYFFIGFLNSIQVLAHSIVGERKRISEVRMQIDSQQLQIKWLKNSRNCVNYTDKLMMRCLIR